MLSNERICKETHKITIFIQIIIKSSFKGKKILMKSMVFFLMKWKTDQSIIQMYEAKK